jgi:hypothetical protein
MISVILTNDIIATDSLLKPMLDKGSDKLYNIILCESYVFCVCYLLQKLKLVNYNDVSKYKDEYIKLNNCLINKFMSESMNIDKNILGRVYGIYSDRLDIYQRIKTGNLPEYLGSVII